MWLVTISCWAERAGHAGNIPEMEQVKHAIGIDSDGPSDRRVVRAVSVRMGEFANRGRRHSIFLLLLLGAVSTIALGARLPRLLAGHTLSDIDARLGGIARLAGVDTGLGLVRAVPLARRVSAGRIGLLV
jgi:hypothetical protein